MSWLMWPWEPWQLYAPSLAKSWLLRGLPLAWKPGPWEVKELSPKHTSRQKGQWKGLSVSATGRGGPRRALQRPG